MVVQGIKIIQPDPGRFVLTIPPDPWNHRTLVCVPFNSDKVQTLFVDVVKKLRRRASYVASPLP